LQSLVRCVRFVQNMQESCKIFTKILSKSRATIDDFRNKYRPRPAGVYNNQIHCYLLVWTPVRRRRYFISEVVYSTQNLKDVSNTIYIFCPVRWGVRLINSLSNYRKNFGKNFARFLQESWQDSSIFLQESCQDFWARNCLIL
jgi:hypothetical protein